MPQLFFRKGQTRKHIRPMRVTSVSSRYVQNTVVKEEKKTEESLAEVQAEEIQTVSVIIEEQPTEKKKRSRKKKEEDAENVDADENNDINSFENGEQ